MTNDDYDNDRDIDSPLLPYPYHPVHRLTSFKCYRLETLIFTDRVIDQANGPSGEQERPPPPPYLTDVKNSKIHASHLAKNQNSDHRTPATPPPGPF